MVENTLPLDTVDADERRRHTRHLARGKAVLYRAEDRMRWGLSADVWDIAAEGLSLTSPVELPIGELLQFTLCYELQRFKKDLRGKVCWCEALEKGMFRVGLELFIRLNGGEIALLKRTGMEPGLPDVKVWF